MHKLFVNILYSYTKNEVTEVLFMSVIPRYLCVTSFVSGVYDNRLVVDAQSG